jgi:hypothetical protein
MYLVVERILWNYDDVISFYFLIGRHVFTIELAERNPSVINSFYNVFYIYSGRITLITSGYTISIRD